MTFDLSRQSPISTVLLLTLLIVLFWGSSFALPALPLDSVSPLEKGIDDFALNNKLVALLMTAGLVFVISLKLARLTIRNIIFLERSYLPALIFLVISVGYYSSELSLRPLISALLITNSLKWLLHSYNRKGVASGELIVAGFWAGLAPLFFFQSVIVVPVIFMGVLMLRVVDIREWITTFVGILLPSVFAFLIYLIIDSDMSEIGHNIEILMRGEGHSKSLDVIIRKINVLQWTFIGTVVFLFILAVVGLVTKRTSYNAKPFLCSLYFIWFALLICPFALFVPFRTVYLLPLVAIPLSVLLPSYYNGRRPSFVSNFLYAMLLLTSIAITLFPLIVASIG